MKKGQVVRHVYSDDNMIVAASDGATGGLVISTSIDYLGEDFLSLHEHYPRKHCRSYPTLDEAIQVCESFENGDWYNLMEEVFDPTKIDWEQT